ncbi:MAG: hypothetical protein KAU50_10120 [Candidatus Marinimicrobia bacterium]|nr:hypothetical protein [Candidatus Neomarinimicrobiota bacterium]
MIGGDLLNEAPLMAIPEEMTFEEYQDMNRRLTVGLALRAIPIPGMIHFYANEPKTGWLILGTAAGGALSILVGAVAQEEGDFPDSDFNLHQVNSGADERRFEKIPYETSSTDTTYRLREIFRKNEGGGNLLILLGAAILITDIAYDFIHGVHVIEEKRDRVRFKYGQQLGGLMIEPAFNPGARSAGIKLSFAL